MVNLEYKYNKLHCCFFVWLWDNFAINEYNSADSACANLKIGHVKLCTKLLDIYPPYWFTPFLSDSEK